MSVGLVACFFVLVFTWVIVLGRGFLVGVGTGVCFDGGGRCCS